MSLAKEQQILHKTMNKLIYKLINFLFPGKNDLLKVKGRIKLTCYDQFGVLKWDTGWISNGITNAGFAQIALLAGDASATPFTYLALGESSTAFSASQTALVTEITTSGLERVAATVSRVTTTQTNDTLQLYKLFTATGTKTVEEIGIFNAASTGTMLGRALTGTRSLTNTDTLAATYQVKFA